MSISTNHLVQTLNCLHCCLHGTQAWHKQHWGFSTSWVPSRVLIHAYVREMVSKFDFVDMRLDNESRLWAVIILSRTEAKLRSETEQKAAHGTHSNNLRLFRPYGARRMLSLAMDSNPLLAGSKEPLFIFLWVFISPAIYSGLSSLTSDDCIICTFYIIEARKSSRPASSMLPVRVRGACHDLARLI